MKGTFFYKYAFINFSLKRVQHLSLRHCKITDKGAAAIGRCLGSAKKANTKLTSLNLTGNLIGDCGVEALAGVRSLKIHCQFMRTNFVEVNHCFSKV